MPNKQQASIGERRAIEARVGRSLRMAFAAVLVITMVVPVAESVFITSNTGKLVMRSIDATALLAMFWSLGNAFLLDRRLKACHLRLMEQLRAEGKDQRHQL